MLLKEEEEEELEKVSELLMWLWMEQVRGKMLSITHRDDEVVKLSWRTVLKSDDHQLSCLLGKKMLLVVLEWKHQHEWDVQRDELHPI